MAMSDRMQSMEEMTKALIADRKMSEPKTKDRSITTTEKQVTMSDPDMFDDLYQLYENEVRKGYKGSFEEYLIDISLGGEEFDPSSPMKVSKLPEGIMQLMNMMKNRRTT